MRHILVMTGTSAIGLVAIFMSDLANFYFLAQLDDVEIKAAVGFGAAVSFFSISIGIGLSIAAAALASPAIGAGRMTRARRLGTNALVAAGFFSGVAAAALWLMIPWVLDQLGASGRTHDLASAYLTILLPSMPVLAVGMCASSLLRSVGDANGAMAVTLIGAVVTVALDPIFIFTFGWGIEGAALASALSRCAVMAVGLYGVMVRHRLVGRLRPRAFVGDLPRLGFIAAPAVLTNLATPFANAYVTSVIAAFGDTAVSGWTAIGRIIPVAFGAIFALTGAIGPIIGQNLGARDFGRVRAALRDGLIFTGLYTLVAWLLLVLAADSLAVLFKATPGATALIVFFSTVAAPLFMFLGALFVANAAFNTLGRPHFSTAFNWLRATLGTIPFVTVGATLGGAKGVIAANLLGGVVFGIVAVVVCFRLIDKLERDSAVTPKPAPSREPA
ncbi:MAG: MATE family efflux transporter [Pseudomonadota bacterium]